MERTLLPCRIGGTVPAISSKSQAHRLFICAALADRPTTLHCADSSADIEATIRCLTALGARFSRVDGTVYPIALPQADTELNCGESGSTLRFLLPLVGAFGVSASFRLHGRLSERPLSPLWEQMQEHGCHLTRPAADTLHCEGRLRGGDFRLPGNVSSQFISGLLLALPLTGESSNIMLTSPLESAPYVDMTLAALRRFSVMPEVCETGWRFLGSQKYQSCGSATVEGDWSNAAFWLCAGAISERIKVTGLNPDSPQGDRAVVSILKRFGAAVTQQADAVTVAPGALRGIELDARNIPDLVPPLAVVAACAEGTTHIYGAQRLRIKESDRLQSVAGALRALGASVELLEDGLRIRGAALHGGCVDSCNDHRIAMLAAIAASVCSDPVVLRGAEAVEKSYPRFWEDYHKLRKQGATK